MEHTEAVRLQAAEKYLLGELTNLQREEYEEHYFDCPACAEELKTTVAFMESARQVVREDALVPAAAASEVPVVPQRVVESSRERKESGWLAAWLRPAFAVPVFAALLLFIGYQNSVTIPNLKQVSSQNTSAKIVNSFSLMAVGARGENTLEIKVGAKEDFALEVDFPPVASATGYVGQILDDSGNIKYSLPVSLEQAKSTVHVNVSGGSLQPGKYSLVILAAESSSGQTGGLKEVKRLPFAVEFQP